MHYPTENKGVWVTIGMPSPQQANTPPPIPRQKYILISFPQPVLGHIPHERVDSECVVWYGTNRLPNDRHDASKGYSSKRDATTHYGSCRVFIPESHKIGFVGSTTLTERLLTGKDDRMNLLAIRRMDDSAYWDAIFASLDLINGDDRSALVFIHGYNVTFEDAALRAAQIGSDLSIPTMAFFSWPSQGRLDGYAADAVAVEASEEAVSDFLTDFCDRSGANKVHIIAHSMGNRALLRAIVEISRRRQMQFGQIFFAAPDVDADVFRQRCAASTIVATRTTLYVSHRDRAIEASRWIYDSPRAGLIPPVIVEPGIDTINVAGADLTRLGHGYVAESRGVLYDVHEAIAYNTPPERRAFIAKATTKDNRRYFVIKA